MTKSKTYWREMEEKYGHQGDRVKCRICGRVYQSLASHITKAHQILADDYKDTFGLLRSFPLVSEEVSEELSYLMYKNREAGKVITPLGFLTSERNTGMKQPDAARKIMLENSKHQVFTDDRRKIVSDAAKKREAGASPEKRAERIKKLKDFYAKRAIYINCSHCGEKVRVSPGRLKSERVFCNRSCFREYVKDPSHPWGSRKIQYNNR